ncbi:unnamed protein product [Effrenium voratum]|uniref:EF-hand domain-containing protein n=1 Tax=Effrenium voratum TaxID=2562239 RepID=A0AA36J3Q8_9DINO|nr:unnamed protein product [Effrenium voratum]CAJ1434982.1 unnamed protein product [Effrenium voratum]
MAVDRAAFADLLDKSWQSFREQVLEAFPVKEQFEVCQEFIGEIEKVHSSSDTPLRQDLEIHRRQESREKQSLQDMLARQAVAVEDQEVVLADVLADIEGTAESGEYEQVVSRVPSLPTFPPPKHLTERADSGVSQLSQSSQLSELAHKESSHLNGGLTGAVFLQSGLEGLSEAEARAIRHRLRVRLGAMSRLKLVSGKSVHEAVEALGLTRYSVEDMNELVNLLADFISLHFEETHSSKKGRRKTIFSWEEVGDQLENFGRPVWKWPDPRDIHQGGIHRTSSMTAFGEVQAKSDYNVVPASALMELFLSQEGEIHRKIFGPQIFKQFQAMREILLAGDTNRLVAELTFVRINDLAAPPEPLHPLMYVEPFVAILIVLNGVMIGFQTDPVFEEWGGWIYLEITFSSFLVIETLLRMHLLGCGIFWCGDDKIWNWFDVVLVVTGVTDVVVQLVRQRRSDIFGTSLLRFCRLIRLVRIVKVFRLKFMKDLRLMVKGLVAGIRTLILAFTLLLSVLYVISGFATMTIGSSPDAEELELTHHFRNLPVSMFTSFRCFTGECTNDLGYPITSLLAERMGLPFIMGYVMSYMLVSMGIFNVILAVYVEITMKAAKETEATTAEQYARESIRVARTTRELLKKFAAAYRLFQELDEKEKRNSGFNLRSNTGMFTDDDVHDKIAITKELFLLVIQDREVQQLMDELDLPPDRANLFEVIDADGSGTLHIAELVQGLLKIRGEIKKSDAVAALLATKAVQGMVAEMKEEHEKRMDELKQTVHEQLCRISAISLPQRSSRTEHRVAHV